MLRLMRDLSRRLFAAPFLVLIFSMRVDAGTGYIDNTGKWHFTVAFYYSPTVTTPPPIPLTEWTTIIQESNTLLYKATSGEHQFGEIKYYAGPFYDPTVDLVIELDNLDDPRGDVYGLNRLGYHVFMSEHWRRSLPSMSSKTIAAKYLIHELGHYLYSLFDEYICEQPLVTPPCSPPIVCIGSSITTNPLLSNKACFMELYDTMHETWCYGSNHELQSTGNFTFDTWQSEANNDESCWSKIKFLYEGDPPTHFTMNMPQDPGIVMGAPVMIPASLTPFTPHVELVVAVEAEIIEALAASSIGMKRDQMLTQLFARFPGAGLPAGHVAFLVFRGNAVRPSAVLPWNLGLITPSSPSYYDTILNGTSALLSSPSSTQIDLERLLNGVVNLLPQFAAAVGFDPAEPRTLLLLTRGSAATMPATSTMPNTIKTFKSKNFRTTIGFFQPWQTVSDMHHEYIAFADSIGATYYDIEAPQTLAYQAIDAANQQLIYSQTAMLSPGAQFQFFFEIPSNLRSGATVSVAWNNPACNVSVDIMKIGPGGTVGGPVLGNTETDFAGSVVKGRKYPNPAGGDNIIAVAQLDANQGCPKVTVTFSISDSRPRYFFVGQPERPILGRNDNHVVHARVLEPYPVINFNTFDVGEIDSLGNFEVPPDSARDDGSNSDWVAQDGIYSKIISTSSRTPGLHTVKFIVENKGRALTALGENLSDDQKLPQRPIDALRREGYVTYFVHPTQDSTLPTDFILATGDTVKVRKDTVVVRGRVRLPQNYPHASLITLTVAGKKIRVDAGRFMDVIIVKPDTLKPLSAKLEVHYRTGDTKTVNKTFFLTGVKGSRDQGGSLPRQFYLYPGYPNPFNASTRIGFDIPRASRVSVMIYDPMGRTIRALIKDQFINSGHHEITWDGLNDSGLLVSNGIYFVRMNTTSWEQVQKVIVLK